MGHSQSVHFVQTITTYELVAIFVSTRQHSLREEMKSRIWKTEEIKRSGNILDATASRFFGNEPYHTGFPTNACEDVEDRKQAMKFRLPAKVHRFCILYPNYDLPTLKRTLVIICLLRQSFCKYVWRMIRPLNYCQLECLVDWLSSNRQYHEPNLKNIFHALRWIHWGKWYQNWQSSQICHQRIHF